MIGEIIPEDESEMNTEKEMNVSGPFEVEIGDSETGNETIETILKKKIETILKKKNYHEGKQ